jgi:kinesin family protein C2/C3
MVDFGRHEREAAELTRKSRSSESLAPALRRVGRGVGVLGRELTALRQSVLQQLLHSQGELAALVGAETSRFAQEQAAQVAQLRGQYRAEVAERRRLFNALQDLRGAVRVIVRCRPPSQRELAEGGGGGGICVSLPGDDVVSVVSGRKERSFEFDRVFGWESTQEQVYKEVSPLITSVLDGFSGCLIAYGQTGQCGVVCFLMCGLLRFVRNDTCYAT